MSRFVLVWASILVVIGCTVVPGATAVPLPTPRVVSERAVAAVTIEPRTNAGDWTQLTFVRYPAGTYALTWSAEGRSSDPRAPACHITIGVKSSFDSATHENANIAIASRDIGAGKTDHGSARFTVKGGDYDLLIDGYGCTWKVSVAAG